MPHDFVWSQSVADTSVSNYVSAIALGLCLRLGAAYISRHNESLDGEFTGKIATDLGVTKVKNEDY